MLVPLLAGVACFCACSRLPQPPAIATDTLDPAVARLVESALREVRTAPRSGAAWGKLASVLMHYDFQKEARFSFEQAEGLSPQDPRWPYLYGLLLMPNQADAATEKLRRAVELCNDQFDTPRSRLAQWLAERGHAQEAERHFDILLRLIPNHPVALLGLARLRQSSGRPADGARLLSASLSDPHTAKSAHALLASIEQSLGDTTAAEAAARRAAELPADAPWPDPYWTEATAYRVGKKALIEDAAALMDQGRLNEALHLLTRLTREYADDDEGWYLMGWALNQQRQSAQAERVLREHLRRSPQSPKGHAQLAVALLGQQRYEEATEVLEAGVKLKPTWREFHSNLGYACVQLGRRDEAIRHYRDALACDPNYAPTLTALAELGRRTEDAKTQ